MMTRKKRIHFLIPAGCLLVIVALIGLWGTPKIIQYAFLPGNELGEYARQMEDVTLEMSGAVEIATIHGVKSGCPVVSESGASESGVTLYMIGERWNEVYPLQITCGEALSYASISGGQRMIVLDSDLAFKLFGDRDPLGEQVDLNGEKFEIIGLAKHRRRLGETQLYAAWIPLGSDDAQPCDLMVASALSGIDGGVMTLFGTAAGNAFGEGTLIGLRKEAMRATMILRIIALAVALKLLVWWLGFLKRLGQAWLQEYRERIRTRYFRQVMGFAALRVLAMLALFSATLAVCWKLMNFFVEPVLVFVEWVPEVLVSFGSIKGRFWELVNAASKPVSYVTAELAEVKFWSAILRWGVIFALIGGVVMSLDHIFPKGNKNKQ